MFVHEPIQNVERIPEHSTQAGARRLAFRIKTYWLKRGFDVNVWAEKTFNAEMRDPSYGVRSDLVNGRPPAGSEV